MARLYYLEDVRAGEEILSHSRTITEADIVNFAGLSGDFSPLHVDEVWARENTPFGGRIAHGMLVSSISYALRAEIIDSFSLVGWLEVNRRFLAPAKAGDTIHARWVIRETRPSKSRPGTGIVILDIEVITQDGIVVQSGFDTLMVNCDPEKAEVNA